MLESLNLALYDDLALGKSFNIHDLVSSTVN